MPLAFTQDDFLVILKMSENSTYATKSVDSDSVEFNWEKLKRSYH